MSDDGPLEVRAGLAIPRSELQYRASRAGGAGGQHVNTSSTRIELLWDLPRSAAISDDVRRKLAAKLASRLDSEGLVRVVSSARRSQQQNRDAAEERLVELVRQALTEPKPRKKSKPTRAAKEQRLSEKRQRSERKQNRKRDFSD
jgi:ribosome-associated protein